jgi:CheY-like chemotaxis protein
MPDTKAKLLIVDDEPAVRISLTLVLDKIGYSVRAAADGLSALAELRNEVPDVLLVDLNMPDMSGFELLSVVRRRFPTIHTIAMSGAFMGNEVPSGVPANAFYQKGSSMVCLLHMLDAQPRTMRPSDVHSGPIQPIWVQLKGKEKAEGASVTIACPECLRSFSHICEPSNSHVRTARCTHCNGLIHFALVEPVMERAKQAREPRVEKADRRPQPSGAHSYFY